MEKYIGAFKFGIYLVCWGGEIVTFMKACKIMKETSTPPYILFVTVLLELAIPVAFGEWASRLGFDNRFDQVRMTDFK